MHTTTKMNSVYLAGWEYSRWLQEDPTQPRISALPGKFLWSGGHQLWMFENVYCTWESYENELEAAERLGWATGSIFEELAGKGIVKTVDWRKDLSGETKQLLKKARVKTLQDFPEDAIRAAIASGDSSTLEQLNAKMLEPILASNGWYASGTPTSIESWFPGTVRGQTEDAQQELGWLASLLIPGITLCQLPGTGVSKEARERQAWVQNTVEKPMISGLRTGEGIFAGSQGYKPYFDALTAYRKDYQPINEQLRNDWERNKDNLYRLRDSASKYIWTDLHGHWLNDLASTDPKVGPDFERWMTSTVKKAKVLRFLNPKLARVFIGPVTYHAVDAALTAALIAKKVPVPAAAVAGAATDLAITGLRKLAVKNRLDEVGRLALFFQDIRQS